MEEKSEHYNIEAKDISGRGGSAFTFMKSTDDGFNVFFLAAGASREAQFDDFYKIYISKINDKISKVEKLKITEMDGFGGRHSLSAATIND